MYNLDVYPEVFKMIYYLYFIFICIILPLFAYFSCNIILIIIESITRVYYIYNAHDYGVCI